MSNAPGNDTTTVVALFGINKNTFGSKFSKHVLPGASREDMHDVHNQMVDHYKNAAKDLHYDYMSAGSNKERRGIKNQMKDYNRQAKKHQKLANKFAGDGPKSYKNAQISLNKNRNAATIPRNNPVKMEPQFNRHQNAAPEAPSAPPPAQNQQQNAAPAAPQHHAPAPAFNNHTNHVPINVHDRNRAPLSEPVRNAGVPITHHIAKLWHALAPHVKHWFSQKRPQSPVSQAHLTGNPAMPISHEDLARHHARQAQFHAEEAIKAKQQAQQPNIPPPQKQEAMQQVNTHQKLANNHDQLAQSAKAKIPKPKPARVAAPPAPVIKPAAPKVPNANVNRKVPTMMPKPTIPKKAPVAPKTNVSNPKPMKSATKPIKKTTKMAIKPVTKPTQKVRQINPARV